MLNLEYIVANSGDSILDEYFYSKGVLTLNLGMEELDKKVKIVLRTDHLSFSSFLLEKKEALYRTCRIEVQDLLSVLSVENGIYVPAGNFGKMMNEAKLKYNLAYGKKSQDVSYIFSLVGYDRLVSCLLPNLDAITIEESE